MIFQLGGMLLLKAPGYRMVEGNSQYVNSYAYSLEKGAQSRKSFYYPMCKLGSSHNPTYYNVGKFNFFLKIFCSVFHSKLVGTHCFQQPLIDLYCDRGKRLLNLVFPRLIMTLQSSPYVLFQAPSAIGIGGKACTDTHTSTHSHSVAFLSSFVFLRRPFPYPEFQGLTKEIFSLSSQSLFMLFEGVLVKLAPKMHPLSKVLFFKRTPFLAHAFRVHAFSSARFLERTLSRAHALHK